MDFVVDTLELQLRNQKERLLTMKAQVSGVGHKASLMASQAALGQAMGGVAGVRRVFPLPCLDFHPVHV